MKTLLIASFFITGFGFGQLTEKSPVMTYVSSWKLENLMVFEVGNKVLFTQKCSEDMPEKVINGSVYFENVKFNKNKLDVLIEFKDTIVNSILYSFKAKNTAILKRLGFENISLLKLKNKKSMLITTHENYLVYITKQRNRISLLKVKIQ